MTVGEQIKKFRLEEKLSQKALGEKLGMSQQMIAQYENGERNPKLETLKRIAVVLNVSLLDLGIITDELKQALTELNQQGVTQYIHGATVEVSEIINSLENLNNLGQQKILAYTKDLSRIPEYQKAPASAPESKIIVLPYFRAGVSAGSGIFILGNEAEDEIELPDLPEYEAADFAIDVNGDSMEPDFSHDDIALVQQDAELFPGDIGVFVVNSNAFIKELGRNELISRNKDYKNIPIHEGDNVVCMGKVIGKVKTDEE
nr:XRE family transcriptional regulator [uncultured Enterocloster sp.]